MALFHTDSIVLCYSNVDSARQWWIQTFDCKQAKGPADWDDPRPSDVALTLAGDDKPTILLCDRGEMVRAGSEPSDHPIVFCNKLKKAHEYLTGKGASPGSIQDSGGTQFFDVRDLEGNVIEICQEP